MLKVRDIMEKKVFTVSEDNGVREICALLCGKGLAGVPVVDKKGRLIGYISDRDIISAVNQGDFLEKKAKDLMTSKVVFVTENLSVDEAAKIFAEKPFRKIPVVKEKKVVGIVHRKAVINRLLSHYY